MDKNNAGSRANAGFSVGRTLVSPWLVLVLCACFLLGGCKTNGSKPDDGQASSGENVVATDTSTLGRAVDTAFVCQNFEYSRADFLTGLRNAVRPTQEGTICRQSFLNQLESLFKDDFKTFQANLAKLRKDLDAAINQLGDEQKKYAAGVCKPLTDSIVQFDAAISSKREKFKDAARRIEAIRDQIQVQVQDLDDSLAKCEDDRKQCALGMYRVLMGGMLVSGSGAGNQIAEIGADQVAALQELGAQGRQVRQNFQKCAVAIRGYAPEAAVTAVLDTSQQVFQPLSRIDWPNREVLVPLLAGLVTEQFSDQVLAVIERFFRGADAQVERWDEKSYGLVTLLNAFAEDRIQTTVNGLFSKVDEFTQGDPLKPNADEKNTLRQHFDISMAAASCRRLFTPPSPGEGRYLMPYVYRAFISNAARGDTQKRVRGYRQEMERVAGLFSCEDADEVKLQRRFTTDVLARKAELYRYLENACNALNAGARDGNKCLSLGASFSTSFSADLDDPFAVTSDSPVGSLDLSGSVERLRPLTTDLAGFLGLLTQSRISTDVTVTVYRNVVLAAGETGPAAKDLLVRRAEKTDSCHSYGKLGALSGDYCPAQADYVANSGPGRYSLTGAGGALPKAYFDYLADVGEWFMGMGYGATRLTEVNVVETRVSRQLTSKPSMKLVVQFVPRAESNQIEAAR